MKRVIILIALLLAGCEEGDSNMPLPRLVCIQVTGTYSCGRGGTCEQCGNWQIGCPKPLKLAQVPSGQYDKGEPRSVCRLKESNDGFNDSVAPQVETPLR
jgi:hypothetical protein